MANKTKLAHIALDAAQFRLFELVDQRCSRELWNKRVSVVKENARLFHEGFFKKKKNQKNLGCPAIIK